MILAEPAHSAPNCSFGRRASQWADRLSPLTPLVSCELEAVPLAFAQAARRRKRAEPFGAAVFIDDPRSRCAMFVAAPPVLAQLADFDERAYALDAVAARGLNLGGRAQHEFERHDSRYLRSAVEFLVTADAVVTRSSVERERLCTILDRRFLHMAAMAPPDPAVPAFRDTGDERRAIVVWAPNYPAEACGILAFALEEMRRPALIVCAGGTPPPMRSATQFISVADGAAALAQAAVIVDASLDDPGVTRALARWGVPVAAASCAGALDWLDAMTVYDPWNHRSIQTAITNALGFRAPRERRRDDEASELTDVLARAIPPVPRTTPLVSVVVPTLNRRPTLHTAIASIAAQTYPNLELVLVNDGGPPIDRAAVGWTRALQVIEYGDRRGVGSALNVGITATRGKYITLVADDDLFCPDHVATLVEALERTGSDVAHAIELCEHFDLTDDGTATLVGHSLIAACPASPTLLLTHNVIGGPSAMFSRAAFDRVGLYDDRAGSVSDLEMWMQLSAQFDFVHVDRVTAVMSMRNDLSQFSAVSGAKTAEFYRYVYGLHPVERAAVERSREQQLRTVELISIVQTQPQLRLC